MLRGHKVHRAPFSPREKGAAMMIEQILGWYGAISAMSTVAFLIFGWAHGRNVT